MFWSIRKKKLEERLANSLKGRIQYHVTRYGPGFSHSQARAWITFDKQELVNFSTISWYLEKLKLSREIQVINHVTDYRDAKQKEGYYLAYKQAEEILRKRELFTRAFFECSVEEYLNLSIEKVLQSENPLIRGFAMLDRRLGKRRLAKLELDPVETQLVKRFFTLRCEVEQIRNSYHFGKI